MNKVLTAEDYDQTKAKLAVLETRLAEIEKRTDMGPEQLASVQRSYSMMIRLHLKAIALYEASLDKRKTLESA